MSEQIARVRIVLEEIEPTIWRLVEVPTGMHLRGLHDVIQRAMGWQDCHLFEFEVGDRVYGHPAPDDIDWDRRLRNARSVRIRDLVKQGVTEFRYIYDFGDYWQHRISIEAVESGSPGADYPRFIAGACRCPPEDVGGTTGFANFIEGMLDPSHEDHDVFKAWYGGPFEPNDIDEAAIHRALRKLAARRRAGKDAYLKSIQRR